MVYHVRKNYKKETFTEAVPPAQQAQPAHQQPPPQPSHQPEIIPQAEPFRPPENNNSHVEFQQVDKKAQNMRFEAPRLLTTEENVDTEKKQSITLTTIIIGLIILALVIGLLWYIFKIRGSTGGSASASGAPSFYYF